VQNPKQSIMWRLLTLVIGVLGLVGPAEAQDESVYAQGEITISCPWMGVGGVMRSGDWVGLRLGINDSASRPREIIVQISIPDADGDHVEYERSMTTNPGTPQPLWMYVRLPSNFGPSTTLNVTAFEAVESGPVKEGERPPLNPGKVLGIARLVRPVLCERTEGLIGIVGSRTMGLRAYQGPEQNSMQSAFGGHERARILARLDADSLPDRWMGLAPLDFLVWSDLSPRNVSTEQIAALREWVQRGGHLIVVLPPVAQIWTDEANNPLADIMPRVKVRKQEGVSLEPYGVLIKREGISPITDKEISQSVIQTFTPLPDASEQEAMGIIAARPGADGKADWLVVRRLVGSGMVTLVGLDLNSGWMDRHGAPDAELFWHRVLGRRGALILTRDQGSNANILMRSREAVTVDGFIPSLIAKRGQAAAGVLLGFVVFIAYWLLAGPAGFTALKKMGWARHGWVAFVAAAGLFTAVAWGGATLIRPGRTEARHLTILDHVYGQTTDHAKSWFSLLVPDYGQMTVTLGEPMSRERTRFHNALAPWEPDNNTGEGFTDTRGYRLDCKNPDQTTIPTRATVKQMQADWAGAPPWKMPRPVSADPAVAGVLRLADDNAPSYATGSLMHELPGPLTDVVVFVNRGQEKLARSYAGASPGASLLADVLSFSIGTWKPGAENAIDLAKKTPRSRDAKRLSEEYFKDILGRRTDNDGVEVQGEALANRLAAISFFSQLEPPEIKADFRNAMTTPSAQRKYSHGLDLSRWLTEPCIIVIGQIGGAGDDQPSPIPLYAGSGASARPLTTAGRTLVRWVYPLPPKAPEYPKPSGDDRPPNAPGDKPEGEGVPADGGGSN
jgi:hypothetical protein